MANSGNNMGICKRNIRFLAVYLSLPFIIRIAGTVRNFNIFTEWTNFLPPPPNVLEKFVISSPSVISLLISPLYPSKLLQIMEIMEFRHWNRTEIMQFIPLLNFNIPHSLYNPRSHVWICILIDTQNF